MRVLAAVARLCLGGLVAVPAACADADQPLGEASCRASARGECPELSGRTFYFPSAGMLIYYAPSGTTYQAETTEISRATWWVDEAGTSVSRRLPFAGTVGPTSIATIAGAASAPGDPAMLSTKTGGFYIGAYDDRSFQAIVKQAAAR